MRVFSRTASWIRGLDGLARTTGESGFADLLNYQAMVGDGVMVLKDRRGDLGGPLLAGWWYRGPDLESASGEQLAELSRNVNNALKRLDAGWMMHVEAIRRAEHVYRPGTFAEPVDQLIDEERDGRAHHYITEFAIFVTQAPSVFDKAAGRKVKQLFFGDDGTQELDALESRIERFERVVRDVEDALSSSLSLRRMKQRPDNDELLQALQLVVNGRWKKCRSPRYPLYLDCLLAQELEWSPREMRHGEDCVAVVGLMDLPAFSVPGLMTCLTHLNTELRWSTRFIMMDYRGARSELDALRRWWLHKVTPFTSQVFGTPGPVDRDALERTDEVEEALSDLESGAIRFGHFTSTVIIRERTREAADEKARLVAKALEARGFEARVETFNQLEALLGSFPGHGSENVRKPILNTLNLADLIPLGHEWGGESVCPSPMFPAKSPPLLQARAWSGSTFDLNLHQGDVGHTLVIGQTGAGKSVFLNHLCTQFLRYPGSQVLVLDQGASFLPLTLARHDGAFYALGGDEGGPDLCPLAEIDTDEDRAWATEWLEGLCDEHGEGLTAERRMRLFDAVVELSESTVVPSERTLTHLLPHLADRTLEQVVSYYSSGVGARVLNGKSSDLSYARLTTFELEALMGYGSKVVVPTLAYLFRQIEKRLDGRPTLLVIDEAWLQLSHPRFAEKLREWLKKLRKKNCAVVMATQQLADVARSPIADTVFECCPTKILLPNEHARETQRALYADSFGLSDAQIELLTRVEKKRWYMYFDGRRSRLFTLDVGPVALAFCGASTKGEQRTVLDLFAQYGEEWAPRWLEHRGLREAASRLRDLRARTAAERVVRGAGGAPVRGRAA